MTSAKFLWLLRDFVSEYHHAKFGCNWTTNKGETAGGGGIVPPPAGMVPKDPSLNRLNTYSMKQPDPYHFETINDVTSLAKFCMGNTSHRRVFSVNFDQACDVICIFHCFADFSKI